MGGRGSSSGFTTVPGGISLGGGQAAAAPAQAQPAQPAQAQSAQPAALNTGNIANPWATPNALANVAAMNDSQLAQLVRASQNVDMPHHLNDAKGSLNATQKFVFQAGMNEQPLVLDDAAFSKFMSDNNIPRSQILSRQVGGAGYTVNGVSFNLTADQVSQIMKSDPLNYVGGKHGGNLYGNGTYFDMNGGHQTGYGMGGQTVTSIAVLNPKTARVITRNQLYQQAPTFMKSHPKFARQVGSISKDNMSIYAVAMGYNVISSGVGGYHNVIDRAALVYRARNL